MNDINSIIDYLSMKRTQSNINGTSHHACALVPNHLKGCFSKVDNLWRKSL